MGSIFVNDPSLPDGTPIEVPGKGVVPNGEVVDFDDLDEDIVIDYQQIIDDAESQAQAATTDSDALPVGSGAPGPATDHGTVLREDSANTLGGDE
jgi:hypothetical protein